MTGPCLKEAHLLLGRKFLTQVEAPNSFNQPNWQLNQGTHLYNQLKYTKMGIYPNRFEGCLVSQSSTDVVLVT